MISSLPTTRTLDLFIVGTGLIGSSLIKQIHDQRAALYTKKRQKLQIKGLADSRQMLFKKNGIATDSWRQQLGSSSEKSVFDKFLSQMKTMASKKSVFVDCTSNDQIAMQYTKVLKAGTAVVTPNKKANSGSYAYYQKLRKITSLSSAPFFYETNVGAGLPIIRTIKDLVNTGDKVLKIEGMLSGTLAYIFSQFEGKKKFSTIVRQAKKLGYTEPDPREDLNGMDVARKLLILSRELGYANELDDIAVDNLMPESCRKAESVNDFFKALEKEDAYFEKKKMKAKANKKRLRYVASFSDNKMDVSLREVGAESPFYFATGSDNIVQLTTKRYQPNAMIIQGPGAGAEVTAAGVFADILRVLES